MAARPPISTLLRSSALQRRSNVCLQCRYLHRLHQPEIQVPQPTPFVPDQQTFLTLIGRGMSKHAAQIPSWEALFTLSSQQLKDSGVEPARSRRYLLWWRERFRNGIFGVGGDCREVSNGTAELRVVEVPSSRKSDRKATLTRDPGTRKIVVNTPPHYTIEPPPSLPKEGEDANEDEHAVAPIAPPPRIEQKDANTVVGIKLVGSNNIGGRGVQAIKGHPGVAKLAVADGLWEERRGHKVDGGERRKAEVRFKRRAAERKSR